MPKDVPLANQVECTAYGAHMTLVDGLISDCARIVGERKEKKWAVVAADIAWGRGSGELFTKAVKSLGKEITAELYTPANTNDFAPYIEQIKKSGVLHVGCEAAYVPFTYRDSSGKIVGFDVDSGAQILGVDPFGNYKGSLQLTTVGLPIQNGPVLVVSQRKGGTGGVKLLDGITGATIADTFPASFTSVSYTAVTTGSATGFTLSGSGNINDTVTMPPGSTITYTVTGTVSASATGFIMRMHRRASVAIMASAMLLSVRASQRSVARSWRSMRCLYSAISIVLRSSFSSNGLRR